ncbi:MAG: hypothetical protein ACOX05_03405 [Bacillota bacterium]
MKKKMLGIVVLALLAVLVMMPVLNAGAVDEESVGKEASSVLALKQEVSQKELALADTEEGIHDIVKKSYAVKKVDTAILSAKEQASLQDLGVRVDKVKQAEVKKDILNYTGETYTKYTIDKEQFFCLNAEGQLISIFNSGDEVIAADGETWDTTEEQYLATGGKALEMLGVSDKYELVKSAEETVDYWMLYYRAKLDNGLINEHDGVTVTVARADNSVAFLSVFGMEANTETPAISEREAVAKAKPVMEGLEGYNEVKVGKVYLKYVQPNFYWTEGGPYEPAQFVRLAYVIESDDSSLLFHVDAVTGEVIGGDEAQLVAGAYGNKGMYQVDDILSKATSSFVTLGYLPVFKECSDAYSMKAKIISFLKRADAYGFYFHGHGSAGDIGIKNYSNNEFVFTLQRTTIDGYNGSWRFVFLNCCSAGTTAWANAFNITNNSSNRVFMGWTRITYASNNAQFARIFFAGVDGSRLYNCAVWAKNQLPTLDLPLKFIGDQNYWGWV